MEIEVRKTVNVPVGPWCGNCYRKEKDKMVVHEDELEIYDDWRE